MIRGCLEASDEALYRKAALEMRAAWLLCGLETEIREAHQHASAPEGSGGQSASDARPSPGQRVLTLLEGFASEAEEVGHLEMLGSAVRGLAERLRDLWRPAPFTLPLFPAFSRGRDPAAKPGE